MPVKNTTKSNTKNTASKEGSKTNKTTTEKAPSKSNADAKPKSNKAEAGKSAKGKKTEKAETSDKTAKRKTYSDSLVVFHGGELLKLNKHCVHLVEGMTKKNDVMGAIYDEFSGYYGNSVSGRFVKCEDGKASLRAFQEACKDHLISGTDFAYTMTSTDSFNAAKKAAGVKEAHKFELQEHVDEGDDEGGEGDDGGDDEDEDGEGDEEAEECEGDGGDEDVEDNEGGDEEVENDAGGDEDDGDDESKKAVPKKSAPKNAKKEGKGNGKPRK